MVRGMVFTAIGTFGGQVNTLLALNMAYIAGMLASVVIAST
jgi:hypothetical protein